MGTEKFCTQKWRSIRLCLLHCVKVCIFTPILNSCSCFQYHVWCFITSETLNVLQAFKTVHKMLSIILKPIKAKDVSWTVVSAVSVGLVDWCSYLCFCTLYRLPVWVCLLVCTMRLLWPWTSASLQTHASTPLLLHQTPVSTTTWSLSWGSLKCVIVCVCVGGWGIAVNNFQAGSQGLSSATATLSILSILFYNCNILMFTSWAERSFQHSDTHTHAVNCAPLLDSNLTQHCT